MNDLIEILKQLDVDNDAHWTSDGLPVIDVVKGIAGRNITRAEITDAAKGFSRKNPIVETVAETVAPEADEEQASEVAGPSDTEIDEATSEQVDEYEAALTKELAEANSDLVAAQALVRKLEAAMDVVIRHRTREQSNRSQAHDIQAYQASQRAQREAGAAGRKAMATMLATNKAKF